MSVQNITSAPAYSQPRQSAARAGASGPSFQERLASTVIQGPPIHIQMPGENIVYSGSRWGQSGAHQEIYAEYTADSTPEDPIVRITGSSDSGPYDIICHVNDVDPACTSYAELAALYGHLVRSGVYQSVLNPSYQPNVLPHTVEYRGDITQTHNFLRDIQESLKNPTQHLPSAVTGAEELLALYQPYASGGTASPRNAASVSREALTRDDLLSALYDLKSTFLNRMKEGKEKEKEQEEWDHLMKQVDAWIASLREGSADIEEAAKAYAAVKADQAEHKAPTLSDYLLEQLEQRLSR